ncbi:MAG TPA: CapA family protein [Candidatus Paceibacterota bacterium]
MKKVFFTYTLILTIAVLAIGAGFLARFLSERFSNNSSRSAVISQSLDEKVALGERVASGEKVVKQSAISTQEKNNKSVKLIFVGDIMLDRGVKSIVMKYGGGDFTFPFQKIKPTLDTADFVFGNLEGPLSDQGSNTGKLYSFRMPSEAVNGLKYASFKALSGANNHSDDWGRTAIKDTRDRLLAAGILPLGIGTEEEAYAPKLIDIRGIKITLLAFTDFDVLEAKGEQIGAALAREEKISGAIEQAKANYANLIIVSFHFGEEYMAQESRRQEKLARFAIDKGADLVIGHHPHVVQPLKQYKGKYIAYSLGNFVFDQNFSEDTKHGGLLIVEADLNGITSAELKQIEFNKYFQPQLVDSNDVIFPK